MTKSKVKAKILKLKLTENDIKRMVKDYLNIQGWFHFHIMQGLGSYPGIPDIIAVKDGQVLFIEVKKPTGKQSERQREFQQNIESHGGKYLIVKDVEDLIKGVHTAE